MLISEHLLYRAAKLFYRSDVAHSPVMKMALSDESRFSAYRSAEHARIIAAAQRYGLSFAGASVLDFGCADGGISGGYLDWGARSVVGVDIDAAAIARAQQKARPGLSFRVGTVDRIPVDTNSIDLIVSYDVFEHVARPSTILPEMRRVLRPGGCVLIGTWSWCHPFAPHLWAVMPVPWAHLLVSERTLLRACRRVYNADWYVPTMFDLREDGQRRPDKYTNERISTDYLNKFRMSDFERAFRASGFEYEAYRIPFGSPWMAWTRAFVSVPFVRELLTGYVWYVLRLPADARGQREEKHVA